MAPRRILLVQGHPDAAGGHLCHALAGAYAQGARDAGHEVREIVIATLDYPLVRKPREWEDGEAPAVIEASQADLRWAQHVVIVYPLWLGCMPALLKGFLEQVARPGFAFLREPGGTVFTQKGLGGRSARVIVTMGMPALAYRWLYGAHSLKALKRNILAFVGFAPVRSTLVGAAGKVSAGRATRLFCRMAVLGARAR